MQRERLSDGPNKHPIALVRARADIYTLMDARMLHTPPQQNRRLRGGRVPIPLRRAGGNPLSIAQGSLVIRLEGTSRDHLVQSGIKD